jgi:hypothetical protein
LRIAAIRAARQLNEDIKAKIFAIIQTENTSGKNENRWTNGSWR